MSDLVLALLLCALSFGLSVWGLSRFPDATFYLAPARAWELLLGSLVALTVLPNLGDWRGLLAQVASGIGLLLIAISIGAYHEQMPFPGLAAAVPCVGAALIILSGEIGPSIATSILSWRPLVGIGLISY